MVNSGEFFFVQIIMQLQNYQPAKTTPTGLIACGLHYLLLLLWITLGVRTYQMFIVYILRCFNSLYPVTL